jgi:hypothetical protein
MYETEWADESGYETGELGWETEGEVLESELAQELLEITSEEELDQFLGKLARSVVKGASKFVRSPVGKALGGVLKTVVKTAAPMAGAALGSMVLPGIGTAIGSKLGSLAGSMLEAEEAERMDEAEAQYEAARRYVRFARAAYRNAAHAPRSVPPRAAVRAATVAAARRHAPTLLRPRSQPGRWRDRRHQRRRYAYRGGYVGFDEPGGWEPDDGPEGAPAWQHAERGEWVRQDRDIVIRG